MVRKYGANMKRQTLIVFAAMLLTTFLGRAREISILNPIPSSGPLESSGPRNIAISPYLFTPLNIDINEDGIPDVSFSGRHLITADIPTSGGSGSVSINTLNNYVLSENHYALPQPAIQYIGEPPAQSGKWDNGSFTISSYSENYILGTSTGWTGPWADVDIGYLSVLFRDSSNQLHSASIRLLVPDDDSMHSMYIMDWFYEVDPLSEPTSTGTAVLSSGDEFQMSFSVRNGLQYVLEQCTNLVEGVWSTNSIVTATSDSLSITNSIISEAGYWRLKQKP